MDVCTSLTLLGYVYGEEDDEWEGEGLKQRTANKTVKGPGRPRKTSGCRPPHNSKSSISDSSPLVEKKVGRPKKKTGGKRNNSKYIGKKVS